MVFIGDLFEYNSTHRVLICHDCKYAVQKNALESHMLRHKIYRGDKRLLLDQIAQFDLLDPDEVQIPAASSPPIHGLEIINGLRCAHASCCYLCSSEKRMRRHWSETHGVKEPPSACAEHTILQTFFRGTKLKYFEVTVATYGEQNTAPMHNEQYNAVATLPSAVASSVMSKMDEMTLLQYFHHFSTVTYRTLPGSAADPQQYWQAVVTTKALHARWLMQGLLAISAYHQACLTVIETEKDSHVYNFFEFFSAFMEGFATLAGDGQWSSTVREAAALINCILSFCKYTLCITTARACGEYVDTVRAIKHCRLTNETHTPDAKPVPRLYAEKLETLPTRMMEPLGRPDGTQDVMATLMAIDDLRVCYAWGFASNGTASVWRSMLLWVHEVSDHFVNMILGKSPAAIIVLAHWLVLVRRTEQQYWFMEGSSGAMLQQMKQDLPQSNAFLELLEFDTYSG